MFITIYIKTSRRGDTAAINENAGELNHCLQQFMLMLIALEFKTIYNCYTHVNSITYTRLQKKIVNWCHCLLGWCEYTWFHKVSIPCVSKSDIKQKVKRRKLFHFQVVSTRIAPALSQWNALHPSKTCKQSCQDSRSRKDFWNKNNPQNLRLPAIYHLPNSGRMQLFWPISSQESMD